MFLCLFFRDSKNPVDLEENACALLRGTMQKKPNLLYYAGFCLIMCKFVDKRKGVVLL
jgi:hypothetical protein